MLRTLSLLIFAAALLPAAAFAQSAVAQRAAAASTDEDPLRIERIDATRWRVTAENREPRILPGNALEPGSRVLIPGYLSRALAGQPVLPVRTLHFGLPPGGTLQYRGIDPGTGAVTERRAVDGIETEPVSGLRWLDNDVVNLLSGLASGLLAAALVGLAT